MGRSSSPEPLVGDAGKPRGGPPVGTVIEVFADVACPFTHVGLRRFVERRATEGRDDVRLRVRAWPLEIVNGSPLDPAFITEEVDELRRTAAPGLFRGYREEVFPATSLPALALAAAAYAARPELGELVSLELRDALFEQGVDISRVDVLTGLAQRHDLDFDPDDLTAVLADHARGVQREVIGSPHFFTPTGSFFCPALDITRDGEGHLHITADPVGFEQFLAGCFT